MSGTADQQYIVSCFCECVQNPPPPLPPPSPPPNQSPMPAGAMRANSVLLSGPVTCVSPSATLVVSTMRLAGVADCRWGVNLANAQAAQSNSVDLVGLVGSFWMGRAEGLLFPYNGVASTAGHTADQASSNVVMDYSCI